MTDSSHMNMLMAKANREVASAMDNAAKELESSMEQVRKNVNTLKHAQDLALAQAANLREKATSLSLASLDELTEKINATPSDGEHHFPIAVTFFSAALAATKKLAPSARKKWVIGEEFILKENPLNPHDPNAIEVWINGSPQVGFICAADAQALKRMEIESGWRLTGQAFLQSRTGGYWGEGSLQVRLENPVLGWRGYNPTRSLGDNVALMEAHILRASVSTPKGSKTSTRSL